MNSPDTWQLFDGGEWIPATVVPGTSDGIISIQKGHTISINNDATLDELVIASGGTLIIKQGTTFTIDNGPGIDLIVNGRMNIEGRLACNPSTDISLNGLIVLNGQHSINENATITINNEGRYRREAGLLTSDKGIWTINSGGIYQHHCDGGELPSATWNTGSLCDITGVISTTPGNLNQPFFALNYNCPNQESVSSWSGMLTKIAGDLQIISTGTGAIQFGNSENYAMVVSGNYIQSGGSVFMTTKSALCSFSVRGDFSLSNGTFAGTDARKDQGEGNPTINVDGNLNITGGKFDFNQYTKSISGKGITRLNLLGNFNQSGGTVTETSIGSGRGDVFFAKSGSQVFYLTGGVISNSINWTVEPFAILDLNSCILTSDGMFTLADDATLVIASPGGITQKASVGNVQVSGKRTYSSKANYIYNGNSSQETGDGLPAVVNSLTIDNHADVKLTAKLSVSNLLTFQSGNLITGKDTLVLGVSPGIRGALSRTSGHVVGNFKRWIDTNVAVNILFPVGIGSYYEPVNFKFTTAPIHGGSITASYAAIDHGTKELNLYDAPDSVVHACFGLWTTACGNGFAGGIYSLDILANSLPGVTDPSGLHLLRRTNANSTWTISGTHIIATGTQTMPLVHRANMKGFGQFTIGTERKTRNPIDLIYFKASVQEKQVQIAWATASEANNDYFTVERSSDGINFYPISQRPGAGKSSKTIYYSDNDLNPVSGYSYYRLKQTDYDGRFSYSTVEQVRFKLDSDGPFVEILSVSPNPFSQNFQMNFMVQEDVSLNFMVLNASGQVITQDVIKATEGYNSYEYLDTMKLEHGVYYTYLIHNEQKAIQKIIKD